MAMTKKASSEAPVAVAPLLRVVRGEPDETEVAAVALVLAIIAGRGDTDAVRTPGRGRREAARWRHRRMRGAAVSWAAGG
jgi:Acyl-CoA carboxylase epsilon subunit